MTNDNTTLIEKILKTFSRAESVVDAISHRKIVRSITRGASLASDTIRLAQDLKVIQIPNLPILFGGCPLDIQAKFKPRQLILKDRKTMINHTYDIPERYGDRKIFQLNKYAWLNCFEGLPLTVDDRFNPLATDYSLIIQIGDGMCFEPSPHPDKWGVFVFQHDGAGIVNIYVNGKLIWENVKGTSYTDGYWKTLGILIPKAE